MLVTRYILLAKRNLNKHFPEYVLTSRSPQKTRDRRGANFIAGDGFGFPLLT